MSEQITITHERTDDIPVIIAFLLKMRVAELIDKHFPTNGNWTGLSLGQMLVVWLTFIISEGDHRLYHVEPWVPAHQHTISRSLNQEVLPRDCTDDRLATGLDYLCVAENWVECECELNLITLNKNSHRIEHLGLTMAEAKQLLSTLQQHLLQHQVDTFLDRYDTRKVAKRLEAELGDEQPGFLEGSPSEWDLLPRPDGSCKVGIDGGYVRNWYAKQHNFEVIVGKSTRAFGEDAANKTPSSKR